MASILQLAQDAADELSVVRPLSLVTSSDQVARRMLRHLTQTCRALGDGLDWQALRREKVHSTIAAAEQIGALPDDYRRIVPGTVFDRTRRRCLLGPLTAEEWQDDLARGVSRSDYAYMIRGNSLWLTPTPPAGHVLAFEYITNTIGTSADGATRRSAFAADTDLTYFDDELVVLGIVWRHRQSEGLDYGESFRAYELRRADLYKGDKGPSIIDMDGGYRHVHGRAGFSGGNGEVGFADLDTP